MTRNSQNARVKKAAQLSNRPRALPLHWALLLVCCLSAAVWAHSAKSFALAFAASVAATSAPPLAPLNLTAQSNRLRRAVDKNKWMSPSKL